MLTPHALYLALGADAQARQSAYRELFRYERDPDLVDEIRKATNGNFALGDTRFGEQIAQTLGRRAQGAGGESGPTTQSARSESRNRQIILIKYNKSC